MRSFGRLMRPLVRLAIGNGLTYPVLSDLLRDLFLDVAMRDVLTEEKARTDSRISLLTGIHRKEIRRQRSAAVEQHAEPEVVTLTSQIIARWLGVRPYVSDLGTPMALPRSAPAGEASFDALIESVTKDVRPRAVLDEWISQDVVRMDADERVVLNVAAFIPRPGREEQLFYFARNLHDHIAAAAANVSASGKAPFMDRSVHYDALPAAAAEKLEALGREQAMKLLVEVNRTAMELADAPDQPAGPTRRVNLGVYLFVEDEAPQGTPQ